MINTRSCIEDIEYANKTIKICNCEIKSIKNRIVGYKKRLISFENDRKRIEKTIKLFKIVATIACVSFPVTFFSSSIALPGFTIFVIIWSFVCLSLQKITLKYLDSSIKNMFETINIEEDTIELNKKTINSCENILDICNRSFK